VPAIPADWDFGHSHDGKPVVRHAPEDGAYHEADNRLKEKMGASPDYSLPVVPRAYPDGLSPAFDGRKAGVVHVDPDAPDGGAIVNLPALTDRDVRDSMASSRYPHEALYKLGESPGVADLRAHAFMQRQREMTGSNPHILATSYVTPHVNQLQPQQPAAVPASTPAAKPPVEAVTSPFLSTGAQAMTMPAAAPLQAQQPQLSQFPASWPLPAAPPAINPELQNMLANLSQGMTQLGAGMTQLNSRLTSIEQERASARAPLPDHAPTIREQLSTLPVESGAARPQRRLRQEPFEDEYPAERPLPRGLAQDQGRPGHAGDDRSALSGYETLGLDFVTGPVASKPCRRVIIEGRYTGCLAAWYHGVEVKAGGRRLTLSYDTRYEAGQQWMPPKIDPRTATPEQLLISITEDAGCANKGKVHRASVVCVREPFGVFDLLIFDLEPSEETPDSDLTHVVG
jgi:hypothetical protein